jgi:hypothetical protein
VEHPLIGNIDDLTTDQLVEKVNELSSKLNIAYRTGNGDLCNQIRMAMESYNTKLREKQQKQYSDSGQNFNDKIKIS